MDKMINLHFLADLRQRPGDSNIGILEGVIGLGPDIGELVNLDGLEGFIKFTNHVDDDIGIGDDIPHGIDIPGTVKNKPSPSQVKHGL